MRKKADDLEAMEERKELFSEMISDGELDFTDSRRNSEGNFKHTLQEVLLVWLCGMICGFNTYRDMEWYGMLKVAFFKRFFPYKHGIPSKSTISRVIGIIDPIKMNDLLLATLSNVRSEKRCSDNDLSIIAIDGKTNKGARVSTENKDRLHMVSAFDTDCGITLAQEVVPEKSNEIIAMKNLLSTIYIKDCTITIDAMGTQKEITKIIRERKAHYILATKENQKTLYHAIKAYFSDKNNLRNIECFCEYDKGHGRIEKRTCYVTNEVKWFEGEDWTDLNSIIMINAERTIGEKTTRCTRYFITSLEPNAKQLLRAIRSHWGIESMHWTLDVTFNEDNRIIWNRIVAHNESIARRIVMNMLKGFRETFKTSVKTEKASYRLIQKVMFADDDSLEKLLRGTFK